MKKMVVFALAVVSFLISVPLVEAQKLRVDVWAYSGTPVMVVNTIEKPVVVRVGLSESLIGPGDRSVWRIGSGIVSSSRGTSLTIIAQVCEELSPIQVYPLSWMEDAERFGSSTITKAFLDKRPSEAELNERVQKIKNILKEKKVLGRKQYAKELDLWFTSVKKRGLRDVVACSGPYAKGHRLYVRDNESSLSIETLFVRERRSGEYYITNS